MFCIEYTEILKANDFYYKKSSHIPNHINLHVALLKRSEKDFYNFLIIGTANLIGFKKAIDNMAEVQKISNKKFVCVSDHDFIPIYSNVNIFRKEQYISDYQLKKDVTHAKLGISRLMRIFNINEINLDYEEIIEKANLLLDYSLDFNIINNTLIKLFDTNESTVLPEFCVKAETNALYMLFIKKVIITASNFQFVNNNGNRLQNIYIHFNKFDLFKKEPHRLKIDFPLYGIKFIPQLKDKDGNYIFDDVCFEWNSGKLKSTLKKVTVGNLKNIIDCSTVFIPDEVILIDFTIALGLSSGLIFSLPSDIEFYKDVIPHHLNFIFRNNSSNYYIDDEVVYSLDKRELLHYPKAKKEKGFVLPDCVENKLTSAYFKNNKKLKFVICNLEQLNLSEPLYESNIYFLIKNTEETQFSNRFTRSPEYGWHGKDITSKDHVRLTNVIPKQNWELNDCSVKIIIEYDSLPAREIKFLL